MRFAHEFDNPFYPWHIDTANAVLFKKAWIHTYEIFKNNGAENVIWVWNPWKASDVGSFYPGKEYVDWIGVDILNYGKLNSDGKWHEFNELYRPFHERFKNLPLTPVIISEFGTLNGDARQNTWISDAFDSIQANYSEIKSVVYFNSKVDKNWPGGLKQNGYLDWTITKEQVIQNSFSSKDVPEYVFSLLPLWMPQPVGSAGSGDIPLKQVIGMNLKKGHNWWRDYHVLDRRHLLNDYQNMKDLGVNTIKFEWNSVYDYNVLNIAKEFKLKVAFGFWVPGDIDFIIDSLKAKQLKENILQKIAQLQSDTIITSWNIQNDVFYNQKNFYHKPELLFQNLAYYAWLKDLVGQIKNIDHKRPLIVDLEVTRQSIRYSKMLASIPGIDFQGLVVKDDKLLPQLFSYLQNSKTRFLYSEIPVKTLIEPGVLDNKTPFFVTSWQDAHEVNKLTFSGIIDWKGRPKNDFFKLENFLKGDDIKIDSAQVAVLKPAVLLFKDMSIDFYAMCYNESSGWRFGKDVKNVSFEWSLVKCDEYGNCLAIKDIGSGGQITLKIPEDYRLYRLLLTAKKGNFISTRLVTLNTPQSAEKK